MFAAIYLPDFALQAVLRDEEELKHQAVAVIETEGSKARVRGRTSSAGLHGVEEGMTPTQALGRCSQLVLRARCPAREKSAREVLLQCSAACSAMIEDTADGVCTADLRGVAPQRQREACVKVIKQLETLGLKAQVAVAENPDLALLAAHRARPLVEVVQADEFLSDLPLELLAQHLKVRSPQKTKQTPDRSPGEVIALLKRWGIQTIGAFATLPRHEIAQRLGAEAMALWECATGRSTRLLQLVTPPEQFEERAEFESELETLEPLLFMLRRFLEQLAARLENAGRVAAAMQLRLLFADRSFHERAFKIPAATHKVDVLFRIVQTHLETLKTNSPMTGLELKVTPTNPEHQQFTLFENALHDPNTFFETLARLQALIGAERVGTPALGNTHRSDAVTMETPPFLHRPKTTGSRPRKNDDDELPPFGLPMRRYRPAIPAQVELRDHRPVAVFSPAANGTIMAVRGPWRVSGDWWDQQRWARVEWNVQLQDDKIYHLVQERGGWSVEGIYD